MLQNSGKRRQKQREKTDSCKKTETTVQVSELTLHGTCVTPTGKVRRCKTHIEVKRMKWQLTQHNSDLVIGVSVVYDRKRLSYAVQNDHLTSLQHVNGTNSLTKMIGETYHQEAPVFKFSNMLQTDLLMKRKKDGVGTLFQKRSKQSSHAGEFDFGAQSILFGLNDCIQNNMSVTNFRSRVESGRSHSVSSPQATPFCAGRHVALPGKDDSCSG